LAWTSRRATVRPGIGEDTGQLAGTAEGGGPRELVISSDFYSVYTSAGNKADGLANLFCWAHIRRYFVRAGDANPDQLRYWTEAWLERIKALYAAHDQLMDAWAQAGAGAAARLEEAYHAWDEAIGAISVAREKQMAAPFPWNLTPAGREAWSRPPRPG
jgi:transposase